MKSILYSELKQLLTEWQGRRNYRVFGNSYPNKKKKFVITFQYGEYPDRKTGTFETIAANENEALNNFVKSPEHEFYADYEFDKGKDPGDIYIDSIKQNGVVDESEKDWKWCVADASRIKFQPVCYDSAKPWPYDVSAERVPRGYYVGYCRTMRKDEAEKLLNMMEDYRTRTMPSSRDKYVVVSREEYEGKSFTDADYWNVEVPGGAIYRN